jgi:hypothetical protein
MKKREPRKRFGIAEWYGRLITELTAEERRQLARVQFLKKKQRPPLLCPSRSTEGSQVACTKEGGVCTIRVYEQDPVRGTVSVPEGEARQLVTICPHRFKQQETIFRWIGELLLGTPAPRVVHEVPFLERAVGAGSDERDVPQTEKVGRIDNVLVHPTLEPLAWCALEMQAVYFSGRAMKKEFAKLRRVRSEGLPFPSEHRRPDYRSSGPKRLMPQLQIKVPTLRRWGKRMAVVVDRPFFNALGPMRTVQDISSCDIAWFVVRYGEAHQRASLVPDSVILTTLEDAVEGLTGGEPVPQTVFEGRIREKLAGRSMHPGAKPGLVQ